MRRQHRPRLFAFASIGLSAACASSPWPEPPTPVLATRTEGPEATACGGGQRYGSERGCAWSDEGGVRTEIWHHSEMGPSFRLTGAAYALDRVLVLDSNDAQLLEAAELPVMIGGIPAGRHRLVVTLMYRGEGSGVFSYLRGYRFRVQGSCELDIRPGGVVVRVVSYEEGGPTTALPERPRVRCNVQPAPAASR